MQSILFAALFVMLMTGCTESVGPDAPAEPPRQLTAAESRVVEADNRFGLNLFRALSEEADGNVFISPLSVSYALGMTLNGAEGETREGMLEALQLSGMSDTEINQAYRALMGMLRELDPKVAFQIANSIWYREEFDVEEEFLDRARMFFEAEIEGLDFADPGAPDIINAWIDDATEGMIERMIDVIGDDVVMYLINAIYFKGDWTYQFDPAETRDEAFRTASGDSVTVPMMRQEIRLAYASRDRYQVVDVPYGDSLYSMTILLPDEGESIDDIIAGLDDDEWRQITSGTTARNIHLHMPRFRIEYETEMNDVLSALGMDIAFTPDADFTGIQRDGGLYISTVKHKAVVDVDEEGTEAAAVTVVEVVLTSVPEVPLVRLDRPFVFSIRERHTGTVLFIGKITNPTA